MREDARQWQRKGRLSRSAHERLAALVSRHGARPVARLLGSSQATIEELVSGGCARSDTIKRLELAIERQTP